MPLIRGEEIIIPTINHNQFVNTIDYNTVINQPIINVIYNIVYPMINNNIFFEWRNIQNIEDIRIIVANAAANREAGGVVQNQTVHDRETEATIQESIDKLMTRYSGGSLYASFTSLQQIILFLGQKADELVLLKKLSINEKRVITINFTNLLLLTTNSVYREQELRAINLLKLAICALEDQDIAKQMCGIDDSDTTLLDNMNDRWAGWFKSSIIDSQLAYRRNRGNMSIPSDTEELTRDNSCFGGNLNRIVDALNLIHPDVVIQEGQGALANMALYLENRKIARIKEFGQNTLQNVVSAYLKTISLETLENILLELEKLDTGELDHKTESMIVFKENLYNHIINNAKTSLEIEDVSFIKRELTPFISVYIDGFLQNEIKETIKQQKENAEICTVPQGSSNVLRP